MSYPSRYYKPALRSTVDVQLQTAFSDSNWATVVRLAEQRFRSLKDPYYEVLDLAVFRLPHLSDHCRP